VIVRVVTNISEEHVTSIACNEYGEDISFRNVGNHLQRRHHNPEDSVPYFHICENLKFSHEFSFPELSHNKTAEVT
jgi:hypothetical protein